ncbi:carnitine dehydratase [Variovorax paradoxus]|jgi:crotonobetainyl-CoA:carnitine CoA-transferase CaiB-like acyl-CoA transferase|uniref:CoA transferase n=1 Tax=Variovorax paradoxus TaxID=34073 RepID=UPI0006E4DFAD|nr:carnitine dehydratase [Variovorax paradoxus]KPV01776.1 carnitine dehydratase [Variovorax paradoxus]KPV05766.1 carnitine dehydratase [Variovorax paradoxus]KPV17455.1 carnitine dehydratase [Variovorax paradoxus]KPV27189.1 carnitine dehydratase [Variovorax paradoxus]
MSASDILHGLWRQAGLPADALPLARLTGADPVLPSSFAVGAAAQGSIAAAALAACELGHARGVPRQAVAVDMRHAALECTGWFSLDGRVPELWDAFSGLYRTADGWVRIHANFAHHREGALRLLGLDPATAVRADAEAAMAGWRALDFEDAAAARGLVATALRRFDEWDATPQGQAIAAQPLFTIERIGDAAPLALPPLREDQRPLAGLRVLDLTRILAGPVGGRALAAYGADVLLVNSPRLPNIEAIADTSRGKLSTHVDLRTDEGQAALRRLAGDAHVFVQGYRPGGLEALGFGPAQLAALRPGIVCVSLTAYGTQGPWAGRRGFDSLVQTAMGFNQAEGEAAGDGKPKPLPMQILDEATGYLIAFGAAAALHRQQREGGSWLVRVSLAQTGHWLRGLGRVPGGLATARPDIAPYVETEPSGFGELAGLRHSALLARTPAAWPRPSMPPGSHPAEWPSA